MATSKRQRQKQGRQVRLEAAREAAKRAQRRKRFFTGVVIAVIVFAVLLVISNAGGGGDEPAATETTTSTVATTTTAATTVPTVPPPAEGASITGETPCPAADGSSARTTTFAQAPPMCIDPAKSYTAVFDTTEGVVEVALDTATTPMTTNNFVVLSRYHYYDDTAIFRTDPSIDIIQGGSPHTNDNTDAGPGYTIPDEGGEFDFSAGGTGPFTYQEGQLIMARSAGANSSGAQFFFSTGPLVSNLDSQGTYLLFGNVTTGLDILQSIIALHVPTGSLGGAPGQPVVINAVTITEA